MFSLRRLTPLSGRSSASEEEVEEVEEDVWSPSLTPYLLLLLFYLSHYLHLSFFFHLTHGIDGCRDESGDAGQAKGSESSFGLNT